MYPLRIPLQFCWEMARLEGISVVRALPPEMVQHLVKGLGKEKEGFFSYEESGGHVGST